MAGTLGLTLAQIGLISAAVGAAGVGASVYGTHEAGVDQDKAEAANKAALLQQQQTAANQANLTKQEAVLGAQGQEQQQTGGSLTDPGTTSLTDLLAGYPGFGTGSGTGTSTGTGVGASGINTANTPGSSGGTGTPDIAAILAALKGSGAGGAGGSNLFGGGSGGPNISGGNWQTQPGQPQSTFQLANPPL